MLELHMCIEELSHVFFLDSETASREVSCHTTNKGNITDISTVTGLHVSVYGFVHINICIQGCVSTYVFNNATQLFLFFILLQSGSKFSLMISSFLALI